MTASLTKSTMRAMALAGPRRLEMMELPRPELRNSTDVLLRMAVVGVCGSDIHYYTDGRIGSQVVQYPFVVGHECAAVVEQVGTQVQDLRPGDRVAVEPAMPCGVCDQCRIGRPHTCRKLRFLGCPGQVAGCLVEYLVMPEQNCFPLPQGANWLQAAMVEPLSIGLYSTRKSVPLAGRTMAILGCGPIGLSVLLCATLQRPERIYMTDPLPARLAMARALGADWAGAPDQPDATRVIAEHEPLLLDVVFDCCGEQAALDQAVQMLKPGGQLVLVGIPSVERVSFVIDQLRRKEINLQNIRRQCECVQPAIDLIEQNKIQPERMVTHRFAFEDTPRAFELVADYADGVVKAVIEYNP